MKNLIYSLCVCFALTTILTSCSNSEDSSLNQNAITLNDEAFTVTNGTILGVSINEEGHTSVTLVSATTTNVKTLTIDVPTFTRETIASTYSFPEVGGNLLLNDHLTSYLEFENNEVVTSTNLERGTVVIKQNQGDNFSITVDLTMEDEKSFQGTYSGNFQVMFQNQ